MSHVQSPIAARIYRIFRSGLASSAKTLWFLLRITVPVSLAVALLGWSGLLATIAQWLAPFMGFFHLPGEAAIVFLSGALLSNYSAIAAMSMIGLSLRQASTLAIMCLVCHNLLVETPVMKRAGSLALTMVALRLAGAFLLGWTLSRLLPADLAGTAFTAQRSAVRPDLLPTLLSWARSTALLSLRMAVLVVVIMIAQRALEEFRIMDLLSRALAPVMFVFGLPRSASFLWIIINAVGYGYGAGIIVAQVEDGKMKPQEGDLFNHHAALSHSLLEDTALYVALGIPLFWIVIPRLILALIVVWLEKLRRQVFRHSFRVGTV